MENLTFIHEKRLQSQHKKAVKRYYTDLIYVMMNKLLELENMIINPEIDEVLLPIDYENIAKEFYQIAKTNKFVKYPYTDIEKYKDHLEEEHRAESVAI